MMKNYNATIAIIFKFKIQCQNLNLAMSAKMKN